MGRAAVYLRYSSDNQRAASLDDQLRNCRRWIDAHGHTLDDALVFRDAAVSGTSMVGRDELERMLALVCVRPAPVSVLVVDDLGRLSRDLGDAFALLKRLTYYGVELVGVSDSFRSTDSNAKLNFGVRALLNDLYIEDLSRKTHRGQEGQALKGRSTGGRLFGYRSVPVSSDAADGKRRVVHEPEAEVVRRMFALAQEGKSLEAIVRALGDAPAPDPGRREGRRRGWCVSSVRVALRNRHYAGVLEWNKRKGQKDPATGKKTYRARPERERVVAREPGLAIVSEELFEAVQRVLDERSARFARAGSGRLNGSVPGATRSPTLLSGLLKCGVCGGAMTLVGGKRHPDTGERLQQFRCAFAKRRGAAACTNNVSISRKKLEAAVIGELQARILAPEPVRFFVEEFRRAYEAELDKGGGQRRAEKLRREVAEQQGRVDRLLGYLEDGHSESATRRLREAEQRLGEVRRELAQAEAEVTRPPLPPMKAIENELVRLRETLAGDDPVAAKALLKSLVGELRLTPERTAAETDPQKGSSRSPWSYKVTGSVFFGCLLVPVTSTGPGVLPDVAGAGFEPATFGL